MATHRDFFKLNQAMQAECVAGFREFIDGSAI